MPHDKDYFCNVLPGCASLGLEVAMKAGDIVVVLDANDNKLVRKVMAVDGVYVYVSRPEEVENAKADGREPNCIGFRLSDVIPQRRRK
jgi:hypothetical protein